MSHSPSASHVLRTATCHLTHKMPPPPASHAARKTGVIPCDLQDDGRNGNTAAIFEQDAYPSTWLLCKIHSLFVTKVSASADRGRYKGAKFILAHDFCKISAYHSGKRNSGRHYYVHCRELEGQEMNGCHIQRPTFHITPSSRP